MRPKRGQKSNTRRFQSLGLERLDAAWRKNVEREKIDLMPPENLYVVRDGLNQAQDVFPGFLVEAVEQDSVSRSIIAR
jgi:hypothetical protein